MYARLTKTLRANHFAEKVKASGEEKLIQVMNKDSRYFNIWKTAVEHNGVYLVPERTVYSEMKPWGYFTFTPHKWKKERSDSFNYQI